MNVYVTQWPGRKNGLAKRVTGWVPSYAASGIGAFELPPLAQTQFGPTSSSLGYDPICDYNVGQFPGEPTRIGTGAEIQACSRACHKRGLRLTADWPIHQYGGRPPYVERGSNGKPDRKLFFKAAGLFGGPRDRLFDPEIVPDDGTRVNYQTSKPAGYMLKQKQLSGRWLDARLGLDGFREDEAKSESIATSRALNAARPGMNVAEVYTGDMNELDAFWRQVGIPVIDFPYHYACRDVSNGAGFGRLVDSAYADRNPEGAYRYVESLDTDGPGGVVNNKLWFYLHGMTTPCKGFRIYAGDFEGYGLGKWILNYAWISSLALGPLLYQHVEDDILCWSRDGNGGPFGRTAGLICGISKDPVNTRWIWVNTPFGPNKQLHNYATSGGPDVWTNADGWANLPFGPNVFGSAQNGFAYSLAGHQGRIRLPALPDHINGSLTDFSM
ncbi:alpha-amylase [Terriglobus roseus]|uniref:Alpha-amylase n=1 Tax=Terriglobus roseus TaxID=392734 RepID=A0A1H4IY12_9BACT|nr:alpha-amylase [Terriglobus roseus]